MVLGSLIAFIFIFYYVDVESQLSSLISSFIWYVFDSYLVSCSLSLSPSPSLPLLGSNDTLLVKVFVNMFEEMSQRTKKGDGTVEFLRCMPRLVYLSLKQMTWKLLNSWKWISKLYVETKKNVLNNILRVEPWRELFSNKRFFLQGH